MTVEIGRKQVTQLSQRREMLGWKISEVQQVLVVAPSELSGPRQIEKEIHKIKKVMKSCEIKESGGAIV